MILTWTLGRALERRRETFNLVGNLVLRVVVGVLLVLVGAEAAAHGGLWLAAAVAVLLLALWEFFMTGLVIWAWSREEPEGGQQLILRGRPVLP